MKGLSIERLILYTPPCLNPETVYYSFLISDYMVLMAAANTEIGVFTHGISV